MFKVCLSLVNTTVRGGRTRVNRYVTIKIEFLASFPTDFSPIEPFCVKMEENLA